MFKNHSVIVRRAEQALMLALAFSLCVCTWAEGRSRSISSSVIRLHVLAASDAEEEQALKLRVRDAVLEEMDARLRDAHSVSDAEEIILASLDDIAQAAFAASEGREVRVSFGDERYPTRVYEGFTLPAGRYRSLRISLGEGQGRNWWCIVYPQACLIGAQSGVMREAMSGADYKIISEDGEYELRLKILEVWDKLKDDCAAAKKHL